MDFLERQRDLDRRLRIVERAMRLHGHSPLEIGDAPATAGGIRLSPDGGGAMVFGTDAGDAEFARWDETANEIQIAKFGAPVSFGGDISVDGEVVGGLTVDGVAAAKGWVPWFTYEYAEASDTASFQVSLDGSNGEPVPQAGFTKMRWSGECPMYGNATEQIILTIDSHADYNVSVMRWNANTGAVDFNYEAAGRSYLYAGTPGASQLSRVVGVVHRMDTATPSFSFESWKRSGLAGNAMYQVSHGLCDPAQTLPTDPPVDFNFATISTGEFNNVSLDFELYYP